MTVLNGTMLVGAGEVRGAGEPFYGIDPATNERLEPAYGGAGPDDVERACALAEAAFDTCRETGLPRGRVEGERARTVGQLRLFADVVREGSWLDARIDPAVPERKPLPRVDLRLRNVPRGPVAVFGASNFPLAFSVAGGDTASAFAAGCPVMVKAHPAHPGTSELVGRAVQAAAGQCGMPEGVFSLLFGIGNWLGGALVADPRVKAVGFTGSRTGGLALMRIARDRPEPIPVYAEMSSINPVILLPAALAARAAAIGTGFVQSLTLGAGQFCTNPGLLLALHGPGLDRFVASVKQTLEESPAAPMLTSGIFQAYQAGTARLLRHGGVSILAQGQVGTGANCGQSFLFGTTAETFLADESLKEEIFGASSLLVRCRDFASLLSVVEHLEGQLTLTLHMETADLNHARSLLPSLERKAGRILANGWPTGVEVAHAMVHGGPFPATSDGGSTSVGTLALRRFLRPVCYQDLPADLLPLFLRDGNPTHIPRRRDGKPET